MGAVEVMCGIREMVGGSGGIGGCGDAGAVV